jgi:hypothetical protein
MLTLRGGRLITTNIILILEAMVDDVNYCRNADSSSKPWCYVEEEDGPIKEYCNIPSCGK